MVLPPHPHSHFTIRQSHDSAHLSPCLLLPPAGFKSPRITTLPTLSQHAGSNCIRSSTAGPTYGPCSPWFLRAVRVNPQPCGRCPHLLFPHCSRVPEKAELTPASGPLLFSLPEMLFSGPCSTSRAQLNRHLPDRLLSNRCLLPHSSPCGNPSPARPLPYAANSC